VGIVVVLIGSLLLVHYTMPVYQRIIFERDPALSYPFYRDSLESVPDALLLIISLIPMICTNAFLILFRLRCRPAATIPRKFLSPVTFTLAFSEAVLLTLVATEFLKKFVGRPRPSFFAMCDYQGYRQAILSGNFTLYDTQTSAGRISNRLLCRESSLLVDAQSSFPSGHSSVSFCAFAFSGTFLLALLHWLTPRHNMAKGMLAFVNFTVAAIIAATRTRDYWHNFDDVLAGSVIGATCALLALGLNFADTWQAALARADTTPLLSEEPTDQAVEADTKLDV